MPISTRSDGRTRRILNLTRCAFEPGVDDRCAPRSARRLECHNVVSRSPDSIGGCLYFLRAARCADRDPFACRRRGTGVWRCLQPPGQAEPARRCEELRTQCAARFRALGSPHPREQLRGPPGATGGTDAPIHLCRCRQTGGRCDLVLGPADEDRHPHDHPASAGPGRQRQGSGSEDRWCREGRNSSVRNRVSDSSVAGGLIERGSRKRALPSDR